MHSLVKQCSNPLKPHPMHTCTQDGGSVFKEKLAIQFAISVRCRRSSSRSSSSCSRSSSSCCSVFPLKETQCRTSRKLQRLSFSSRRLIERNKIGRDRCTFPLENAILVSLQFKGQIGFVEKNRYSNLGKSILHGILIFMKLRAFIILVRLRICTW